MENDKKVLACVDQSHYADCVADYAAWAARRLQAPLEFLHVIDRHSELGSGEDHSGVIGIDAQESLLVKLSSQDEARSKLARENGRIFLNRLRERALTAGVVQVDMRQRYGELEQTLTQQEDGVRLTVLGRRGEAAASTGRDLGRKVERVVRSLRKPILAVPESFKEPERVMIAFDGTTVTRRGIEMVAGSPLLRGLPIHLLMSGRKSLDGPKQMEWAKTTLETAGFSVSAALIHGDPETTIARAVKEQSIDLLVMGAFGHSPLRSLLLGSKTADLLRSSTAPTLLLR